MREATWASPLGPVCAPCRNRHLRSKITCSGCGESRRPATCGDGAALCADCAGIPSEGTCSACGREDQNFYKGLCGRCSVKLRIAALRESGAPEAIRALDPYLRALEATAKARSVLRWIDRSPGYELLERIASGEVELTHDGLDQLQRPGTTAVTFLRAALVAHQALPERDEDLAALQRWVNERLTTAPAGPDRVHLRAYASWRVINDYSRRLARGGRARPSQQSARHLIAAALELTSALHSRQLELGDLRQDLLDEWLLTGGDGRRAVKGFLQWLTKRSVVATLEVERPAVREPVIPIGDRPRLRLVGRLLEDDQIETRDRVAGLLVLLYAQFNARIARLRRDEVSVLDGHVHLRLGTDPVRLPTPLGELIIDLATEQSPKTTIGAESPWLLPGHKIDQPINPGVLSRRLRRLEISGQPARTGALLHLLHNVPPTILADMIGISPETAERYSAKEGTPYARYVALRQSPHSAARG